MEGHSAVGAINVKYVQTTRYDNRYGPDLCGDSYRLIRGWQQLRGMVQRDRGPLIQAISRSIHPWDVAKARQLAACTLDPLDDTRTDCVWREFCPIFGLTLFWDQASG